MPRLVRQVRTASMLSVAERILVLLWITHLLISSIDARWTRRVQESSRQSSRKAGAFLRTGTNQPPQCGKSGSGGGTISRGAPAGADPGGSGGGWGGAHPAASYLSKRIVGGRASGAGEWPWLVTLRLRKNETSGFEHTCGGTLVHQQWVVTAAHCFESLWATHMTADPSAWQARVGEHDMFSDDDEHQADVAVERIIIHPLRNPPKTFNYDIAMVKLARPVRFSSNVNIVCLPSNEDKFIAGTTCITAGWGHLEEGGELSTVIQHVEVPIISKPACNRLYQRIAQYVRIHISNDMLCAGFELGGRDACQYDSGGPMVYHDRRDDVWILVGIVSTGYGCARPGFPGIYTKVSEYVPWIEGVIDGTAEV